MDKPVLARHASYLIEACLKYLGIVAFTFAVVVAIREDENVESATCLMNGDYVCLLC